jgi:fucose permease
LSTTPIPPRTARIAVSFMFFANGALLSSWASRIPTVQQHLQLNAGELGTALWGLAVGAFTAFLLISWLMARLGSRLTTTLAAIFCCIVLVLPALAPNAPLLWLSLALLGAGNSAMDVAMNAQGAVVEERYGRPIMSSFHGLWSIGSIIGASYGSLMAWLNISPLLHFIGIAILIGLIILPISRWLLPVTTQPDSNTPIIARPTRALLGLGIIGFCSYLSEGAIADWSGVYLHSSLGTSTGLAAAGFACYSVAMTIARLNGDHLTQHIGPDKQARFGGLLAATGLGLALLIHQPIAAIIGFVCVGAGLACIAPLVFSTASRIPGHSPAVSLAAVATMAYMGSLVGPPVIGQLADILSLRGALGLIVLFCAIIALLAHSLRRAQPQDNQIEKQDIGNIAT